jgi:hypothetical protein
VGKKPPDFGPAAVGDDSPQLEDEFQTKLDLPLGTELVHARAVAYSERLALYLKTV